MGTDNPIRLDAHIAEAGYEAGRAIIRDIHIEVRAGELIGLIGPNGAGKSTTIKTLLGQIKHVQGQIALGDGSGAGRYAYVPEQPVMYDYLTLWEHLRLAAAAFGLSEDAFASRAEGLLERFRLSDHRHAYPAQFSKGMQQKMMLIAGFLIEPDLYIVDEPFVGLDPRATIDLLELLRLERERGAGVLMSTHVLDTAERICNGFVLLNEGESVARGTLDEVRKQAGLAADATLFDCFLALT